VKLQAENDAQGVTIVKLQTDNDVQGHITNYLQDDLCAEKE
jgi:hypothetical protein